ncbi:hypothetical protein AHiyo1_31720 [Arthrobacter sp. Hiyo1]|nr:hypothetical protein AHiyo1_31720 [Arthrobacter sp. Hiyo1]
MTVTEQAPRVAVVGAAGWAGSRHARAFAAAGANVVFLVDKDHRATHSPRNWAQCCYPAQRHSAPRTWT